MKNNKNQKIKDIISGVLDKMNLKDIKIDDVSNSDVIIFNIQTKDSPILIGKHGENLSSLQHIVYIIVNNQIEEVPKFIIDVNNYRSKQKERFEYFAKQSAEKVISTQRSDVLRPMNSYQRKIIHDVISSYDQLSSTSIGQEPNRRVLVRLKNK